MHANYIRPRVLGDTESNGPDVRPTSADNLNSIVPWLLELVYTHLDVHTQKEDRRTGQKQVGARDAPSRST